MCQNVCQAFRRKPYIHHYPSQQHARKYHIVEYATQHMFRVDKCSYQRSPFRYKLFRQIEQVPVSIITNTNRIVICQNNRSMNIVRSTNVAVPNDTLSEMIYIILFRTNNPNQHIVHCLTNNTILHRTWFCQLSVLEVISSNVRGVYPNKVAHTLYARIGTSYFAETSARNFFVIS